MPGTRTTPYPLNAYRVPSIPADKVLTLYYCYFVRMVQERLPVVALDTTSFINTTEYHGVLREHGAQRCTTVEISS